MMKKQEKIKKLKMSTNRRGHIVNGLEDVSYAVMEIQDKVDELIEVLEDLKESHNSVKERLNSVMCYLNAKEYKKYEKD